MTKEKIPKILAAFHLYYVRTIPYKGKEFLGYSIYCSIKRTFNYKITIEFKNNVVIVRNDIDRFEFSIDELKNWNFNFEESAHG